MHEKLIILKYSGLRFLWFNTFQTLTLITTKNKADFGSSKFLYPCRSFLCYYFDINYLIVSMTSLQ